MRITLACRRWWEGKRKASLNYIKERVWSKVQWWKEKLLSQADREILLKAVVQAIPTFAMSCFKLPVGLCHEIEALIRKFFWWQKGVSSEKFIGKNGRFFVSLNQMEQSFSPNFSYIYFLDVNFENLIVEFHVFIFLTYISNFVQIGYYLLFDQLTYLLYTTLDCKNLKL